MIRKAFVFVTVLLTGLVGIYATSHFFIMAQRNNISAQQENSADKVHTINSAIKGGIKTEQVIISGRLWKGNQILLMHADQSLEAWRQYLIPENTDIPRMVMNDFSLVFTEVTAKRCNGALINARGILLDKRDTPAQGNAKLTMNHVEEVTVVSGLPVTFQNLILHAGHYHETVVQVEGIIGTMPPNGSYGLFLNEDAQDTRDAEQAFLIERNYALQNDDPDNAPLAVLHRLKPGSRVRIDALYQRAFKEDPHAPNGRLVYVHHVKAL